MSRQCKQRKLNERRRSWPHVSARALGSILKSCREEGEPEGNLGRDELRFARDVHNNESTPLGPIASCMKVVGNDGNPLLIPVANPHALLWMSVNVAAPWVAFLEGRLEKTSSNTRKSLESDTLHRWCYPRIPIDTYEQKEIPGLQFVFP